MLEAYYSCLDPLYRSEHNLPSRHSGERPRTGEATRTRPAARCGAAVAAGKPGRQPGTAGAANDERGRGEGPRRMMSADDDPAVVGELPGSSRAQRGRQALCWLRLVGWLRQVPRLDRLVDVGARVASWDT